MNLAEILEKENIKIEENIDNVLQYGIIDLSDIEKAEQFSSLEWCAENLDNNYEISETTYTIYKNDNLIYESFTDDDLVDFLKTLEKKYE